MEKNDLILLGKLPDDTLTSIFVELYSSVQRVHDRGWGFVTFGWQDIKVGAHGKLSMDDVDTVSFTETVASDNRREFAALIYCVATGKTFADGMSDAGQRIRQPVLREIVLTFCGRNNSVAPLLEKLRHPYIDEETFFDGYTSVDEKEASEAYAEKVRMEEEQQKRSQYQVVTQSQQSNSSGHKWYYYLGVVFMISLASVARYSGCSGGGTAGTSYNGVPHIPVVGSSRTDDVCVYDSCRLKKPYISAGLNSIHKLESLTKEREKLMELGSLRLYEIDTAAFHSSLPGRDERIGNRSDSTGPDHSSAIHNTVPVSPAKDESGDVAVDSIKQ